MSIRMWIADGLYWLSRKLVVLAEYVDPGHFSLLVDDIIYDIHPLDTPFEEN